jgi:hypothetical protein
LQREESLAEGLQGDTDREESWKGLTDKEESFTGLQNGWGGFRVRIRLGRACERKRPLRVRDLCG